MSGKTKTVDTTSPTETTSTTSSSYAGGSGVSLPETTPPSIGFMPPQPGEPEVLKAPADGENETVKSLRRMGIRTW